jgi:hypothetical protein
MEKKLGEQWFRQTSALSVSWCKFCDDRRSAYEVVKNYLCVFILMVYVSVAYGSDSGCFYICSHHGTSYEILQVARNCENLEVNSIKAVALHSVQIQVKLCVPTVMRI